MKSLNRAILGLSFFLLPLAAWAQEYPAGQQQQPSFGAQEEPGTQKESAASEEATVSASSVQDSKVLDNQGNEIGTVKGLRIDTKQGRIVAVDIAMAGRGSGVTGVLGGGEQMLSVPWNAIEVRRQQDRLVLALQDQVIPEAPKRQKKQTEKQQSKQ